MTDVVDLFLFATIAGAISVAVVIVSRRMQPPRLSDAAAREDITAARAKLEEARRNFDDERRNFDAKVKETFGGLAAQALTANNEQFLVLAQKALDEKLQKAKTDIDAREKLFAETVLKPFSERLGSMDGFVRELEIKREKAYTALDEQLKQLGHDQMLLRTETGTLATALKGSQVRGRWGELTMERIAELAGMREHCDFESQVSVNGSEGRMRPDMIVRLPGQRELIVDSKVPLASYLEHLSANTPEARTAALEEHARALRSHVASLKSKAYWEQFEHAPDFVILFVPIESAVGAAVHTDPGLLADAATDRVLIASPVTLIAMLRAAEYGWRQEKMADNAREISSLGRDLYDRFVKFGEYLDNIGAGLGKAVKSYNEAVGSYDSRLVPQARKFKDYGAAGTEEVIGPRIVEATLRASSSAAEVAVSSNKPALSRNGSDGDHL